MIGICTDSNAQVPPELADRFVLEVVPLTVVIDGTEYLEGVGLDADSFYGHFAAGARPHVRFVQPSAGQFAVAFDDLVERGCGQILSIHTSFEGCATLQAARLAAHGASVPVRLADSRTAGFGVSCCVWSAGDALAGGATVEEAAGVAESLSASIGNVFLTGAFDAGGTLRPGGGAAVMTMDNGGVRELERVESIQAAVDAMARYTLAWGDALRVAVGTAHRDVRPVADELADALGRSGVAELLHYRIGPSDNWPSDNWASDNGGSWPGTVSCVMYPSRPSAPATGVQPCTARTELSRTQLRKS